MKSQPKKPAVRLFGRAKQKFKHKLYFDRANRRCETCKPAKFVPLTGTVFEIAHLSHIKSYGAGGGDTEDNCLIECYDCHINARHGPKWNNKEKGG